MVSAPSASPDNPAALATQTRYRVSGMDCASCAAKIDTAVRRIEGVEDRIGLRRQRQPDRDA